MPDLSRSQVLVYGAICVALLLVGVRWLRSSERPQVPVAASAASPGAGRGGFEIEQGDEELLVHVAGAVRRPGVYRLPAGSRVTDAVERAGGSAPDALADGINLAAPLSDGQQVLLPARVSGGVAATGPTGAPAGPISLGSATVEELDTIEGIGPVTASQIIEFRDQNGGLASVDELDQISGIGPTTMEALRARLQP